MTYTDHISFTHDNEHSASEVNLCPKLFTLSLDNIYNVLEWPVREITFNDTFLNHLSYADNI